MKWVLGVLGTLVLTAGIIIGGWNLYWWIAQSSAGHQNHIQRYTYGFQTAQLQDAENTYSQIAQLDTQMIAQPLNAIALNAQKSALETQFCADYETLVTISVPPNIKAFAAQACNNAPTP